MITKYLQQWRDGDPEALDRLTAAMYSELRRVAGGILRGGGQTVEPTVLVHELYFQLPRLQQIDWQSRAQFLCVAARVMRNILVDYARRRRAAKRGGSNTVFVRGSAAIQDQNLEVDALLVHELLERFAVEYPRHAQVVELRFFGGLTTEETAEVLKASGNDASERTIARDWVFAKAWLQKTISEDGSEKHVRA